MDSHLLFIMCIARCFVAVLGYPSGAISDACSTMLPIHGSSVPMNSVAPYTITVSKTSFNPLDIITVTLQANSSASGFKGFLIQARSVGGNRIVGSFTVESQPAQTLSCNGPNSAVSHINNNVKTSIAVQWTAPTGAGPVVFRATVLSSYSIFWYGVESPILTSMIISNETCGSEKFCLTNPEGCSPDSSNCYFMSSVSSNDRYVIEISGSTSGYVALGFSDDTRMGNDDVYICTKNSNGNISVQHAFNTGKNDPTVYDTNSAGYIVTRYVNGVLQCSFITQIGISTQARATSSSSYYLFLASGPSDANGKIMKHSTTPLISSTKVDLSSFALSGIQTGTSPVILAHGALMLIAWMTTGTIGMFMARYMKSAAAKPFMGKALWFQVHFYMMILTVILTIIAFIMIFVEVNGWSGDIGAHPVLGCIVMILSLIQPIVALFRPDPKSQRRSIFNWGHSINALVIKVLAVATIFLGLRLIDTTPTLWLSKVMGASFAWKILFFIILEINMCLKSKELEKFSNAISNETLAFLIFICGNLAFLIALLVGIGRC
ncbi:putative ferric-chelate reductase 1 [Pelodytes ibericus]